MYSRSPVRWWVPLLHLQLPILTLPSPELRAAHLARAPTLAKLHWHVCGAACRGSLLKEIQHGTGNSRTDPAHTDSKARRISQFSRLTFVYCQPLNLTQPILHQSSGYAASLFHEGTCSGFGESTRDAEYRSSLCIFFNN